MKILQLIYESFESPFGFGGAGVRAYEIYKRLKDRHDITLLCMKYPDAKDCEIEGLRHIFIGSESKNLTWSVLQYTLKAANFIKKYGNDFDIIVENFLPSTPFFSRLLTKTKVILQVQGIMEIHYFKKFNPFYSIPMSICEKFYPNLYENFIFVSDVTKKKLISKIKRNIKFCQIIPNGISEDLLKTNPENGDYILFLSRIDIYTKGLDILIKAFQRIHQRYPELKLILAGYEFDKFSRLITNVPSDIRDKIIYAGFVIGQEKIKLLAGARIFILPSRHESLPVSILEAAACMKPVIVSDIPELSFVQKEGFGLSFKSGSIDDLSERIAFMLNNHTERMEMGKAGRRYASNFLWDKITLQFEKSLESVF